MAIETGYAIPPVVKNYKLYVTLPLIVAVMTHFGPPFLVLCTKGQNSSYYNCDKIENYHQLSSKNVQPNILCQY